MKLSIPSFPNSTISPFTITSPPLTTYNCISWAYGINSVRMWPNTPGFYWPANISNINHINSFIDLFRSIGYNICPDGNLENGFEKIAIFEDKNVPTHAARQLANGLWTSKLGHFPNISFDASHTINSISGGVYGNVSIYMKRLSSV